MDLRALGTLQLLDDGVDRQVVDGLSLDLVDDVAGADAEPVGGRALDRRDDGDLPLRLLMMIEAVEGPALLLDHRGVLLGFEEVRVRVEGAEHPVDGRVDELVRRHVVRVPGARGREDVGVLLEAGVRRVRDGRQSPTRDSAAHRDGDEEDGGDEGAFTAWGQGSGGCVHEGPSRTHWTNTREAAP